MPDPIRIFISYRREDTRHVAGRLGDRLMGEKFIVFMDIETIVPGMDFTQAVQEAVDESDVLLALIGSSWLTLTDAQGVRRLDNPADWVVQEISTALRRGIVVIPLLVDGVAMPDASVLPESIAPLARRQALALRHESFADDAERLVEAITRLSGRLGAAERARQLQTSYDAAIAAGREGRWKDAATGLAAIVAVDPEFRDAKRRLEQARQRERLVALTTQLREQVRTGRWAAAVATSDALRAVDPNIPDPDGLMRRARTELDALHARRYDEGVGALRQGQWDIAVRELGAIVAERPTYRDAAALHSRAQQQQRLLSLHRNAMEAEAAGRWADAIRTLEMMQSIDPSYADGPGRLQRARAKAVAPPRRRDNRQRSQSRPMSPGRIALVVGAALLALVLLIVTIIALSRAGDPDDGGSSTPVSTPASTPGSIELAEQLRGHVPTAFRSTCEVYEPDDATWRSTLVVALRCVPGTDGPDWVIYFQYDTTTSAQQVYRKISGDNLPSSDCKGTEDGEFDYEADAENDPRPGKVSCSRTDPASDRRDFVWVDNELAIVANAWDDAKDYKGLYDWWTTAGPIAE